MQTCLSWISATATIKLLKCSVIYTSVVGQLINTHIPYVLISDSVLQFPYTRLVSSHTEHKENTKKFTIFITLGTYSYQTQIIRIKNSWICSVSLIFLYKRVLSCHSQITNKTNYYRNSRNYSLKTVSKKWSHLLHISYRYLQNESMVTHDIFVHAQSYHVGKSCHR
jgi:hypothetical protein